MSTITHDSEVTTVDVPAVSPEEGHRREILLKAADIIETHGWEHGSYGMHVDGGYCVTGAVAHAMNAPVWIDGCGYKTLDWQGAVRLLGVPYRTAYRWNDRLSFADLPRVPNGRFRKRKMTEGEAVARALRRMANGMSWRQATADTQAQIDTPF